MFKSSQSQDIQRQGQEDIAEAFPFINHDLSLVPRTTDGRRELTQRNLFCDLRKSAIAYVSLNTHHTLSEEEGEKGRGGGHFKMCFPLYRENMRQTPEPTTSIALLGESKDV